MKNIILAVALAASSIFVTAAPSDAANVTIIERVGPRERTTVRESYRAHRPRQHCVVKKVRIRDNGRVIIRTKRICR